MAWSGKILPHSGTTMIAAERTGRRARLLELDPRYADVIVQRWQQATCSVATLSQVKYL